MKKFLTIIVLCLLWSGNINAKEYVSPPGSWSWSLEHLSGKTGPQIVIEAQNYENGSKERVFTKFLLYKNCSNNKTLIATTNIENEIGKQVTQPWEKIKFSIKPPPFADLQNLKDTCAQLYWKDGFYVFNADYCINEKKKGSIKYNICKIKNADMYKGDEKISRGEAADECSRKSKFKISEVRSQYYKDCMKDSGY